MSSYKSPAIILLSTVPLSVPPEKPKIFDVRGQEVQLKLGPFRVGDSALIKCETWGGETDTAAIILPGYQTCDSKFRFKISPLGLSCCATVA